MKGVRLNIRKGCFTGRGGRPLKGVHSLIKEWYAKDYKLSEAKQLALQCTTHNWDIRDDVPKPGFANGSRIDLEMHRWASKGEEPTHTVARNIVEKLRSEGFARYQGKHGVKSKTDYVYTEIDFLVQRNNKIYAVELKSGYDVEFYQSTGRMAAPLSDVDNSLCNQAIVQVS